MRLFQITILSVLTSVPLSAEVIGIFSNNGPHFFLVDSSLSVTQVNNSVVNINAVAINDSALSVIVGNVASSPTNYASLVSSGNLIPFSNNGSFSDGACHSTAINKSGNSVAGGDSNNAPLLIKADPSAQAGGPGSFTTSCGISGTALTTSAINSSGWVLAGGNSESHAFTGLFVVQAPPGITTDFTEVICESAPSSTTINSVDLNDFGQAVAGGILNGNAYTALFNVLVANPLPPVQIVTFPFATGGQIFSVSINSSGTSLIGGVDNNSAAYAALLQPGQTAAPSSLSPLPTAGQINSVEITDGFGYAIIGGSGGSAYAAFVDILGNVYPIKGLPTGASSSINSVSMNKWGIALIGGTDGTNPYVALVNPFDGATQLNASGLAVTSVSIRNFKSAYTFVYPQLTGNNLIFAKYILRYASQSAQYLSPSFFDGTFIEALESAAPTRNAFSVFAADNNLFFLNNGLSSHLNHLRQKRYRAPFIQREIALFEEDEDEGRDDDDYFTGEVTDEEDGLLAMSGDGKLIPFFLTGHKHLALQEHSAIEEAVQTQAPRDTERPLTLWGNVIGAWSSQKAQHQTVAFDPISGGFVVALEKSFHQKNQVGGGVSYMYTHVHEEKDAGSSHINQECLFLYGSWLFGRFYLDTALWGGLFQTDQERKVHMTGFDFKSTSHPNGGQFDPHLEFGYTWLINRHSNSAWRFMIDPFAMADWVNTWQGSYKEKGADPFNAGQKSHYSSFLRTEAGFRFYEGVRFDSWVLGLEQKASYVYKKPFSVGKVKAFIVGSPGSFTVETLTAEENLGLFELGILFNPVNRSYPYGSIAYQGEFSHTYQSQQLTLELDWDF